MLEKFRKLIFKDEDINRFQQEISKVFDSITSIKLLDGNFIDSTALSTSTVMVPHGLNREYQGFIVVDADASAIVYRDATATDTGSGKANDKTKFIPLKASASVNVKLWVF